VITIERRLDVPHPPQQVWDRLADFEAISAWADNVDHSCLLHPGGEVSPVGVGATRRVQVGRRTLVERVVVWDEPQRLAYQIEGLPPVVTSLQNEWRLQSVAAGAGGAGAGGAGAHHTRVTLATTVECGPRPPQKLVARLIARRMAGDSDTMLSGLAHSMKESSHA
jgi:uncharacterized protein YndB with AHSA1/START domain